MTESLSIWSLIVNASFIVQMVMLVLFLASGMSWVVIIQRHRVLKAAKAQLLDFEDQFWSGIDLGSLYKEQAQQPGGTGVHNIFMAGFKEFTRLRQQNAGDPESVMEGTQRAMRVVITREAEYLDTHLSFLATVGSTSPYIGLFGTVWGIMNSFRGLANVGQATIATVAPGISEALVATAIGLFAAIPAVIAYNRYAAKVDSLTTAYQTFADEFSSILHRQVHVSKKEAG